MSNSTVSEDLAQAASAVFADIAKLGENGKFQYPGEAVDTASSDCFPVGTMEFAA